MTFDTFEQCCSFVWSGNFHLPLKSFTNHWIFLWNKMFILICLVYGLQWWWLIIAEVRFSVLCHTICFFSIFCFKVPETLHYLLREVSLINSFMQVWNIYLWEKIFRALFWTKLFKSFNWSLWSLCWSIFFSSSRDKMLRDWCEWTWMWNLCALS